jgi:hypothetical protein
MIWEIWYCFRFLNLAHRFCSISDCSLWSACFAAAIRLDPLRAIGFSLSGSGDDDGSLAGESSVYFFFNRLSG